MSVLVIPANPFLLLSNLINVQRTENLTLNSEASLPPLPTSEYVFLWCLSSTYKQFAKAQHRKTTFFGSTTVQM